MAAKLEERLNKKRKRRRRNMWVALSLLPLLLIAAGALSYWWFGSGKITTPRVIVKRSEEAEHFIVPPNKLNILIMGVDDRPNEDDPGRSDTLLVMTVDTESREASIISIPRDTRVRIKGLGWDKINHAYAYGGVEKLRETVVNFLGLPVNYYVLVNYDTFPSIIDLIGGVEVDGIVRRERV